MLEALTGSADAARCFLTEHWPLRWAHFHGPTGRLPALFESPALASLTNLLEIGLGTELWWEDGGIRAARAEPSGAARLYKRGGLTLRFMEAETRVPALREVLNGVAAELDTPIGRSFANIYLTPPGVHTAMHFDGAEVMIAQIAGRKRWRVAENEVVASPGWGWAGGNPDAEERRQMNGDFASAALSDATEVELAPGSLLFLPRGCWHGAVAEEESISVSLAFECLTRLDVAFGLIRQAAIVDPSWRRPAARVMSEAGRAELDRDLRRLGAALAEQGIIL